MARLVYTLVAAFVFAPPTMVAAFAFARPGHLSPRSTVTITRSWWEGAASADDVTVRENSAQVRRAARTRAKNPATMNSENSGRGKFSYTSDSSIGGSSSSIPTSRKPATNRGGFTYDSDSGLGGTPATSTWSQKPRAGFTYQSESQIGGSQTAEMNAVSSESDGRKAAQAATPAEARERIARDRALLQTAIDERFRVLLTPHLAAFSKDAIDEAELARHKAEARKDAKKEHSARSASLDECEALLDVVVEVDAHVSSLSKQLEEMTLARDKATEKLQAVLEEVAV